MNYGLIKIRRKYTAVSYPVGGGRKVSLSVPSEVITIQNEKRPRGKQPLPKNRQCIHF